MSGRNYDTTASAQPTPASTHNADDESENDGMFLEKEDILLISNALSAYKPKAKEAHLHSVLLEQFEEILAVDFTEIHY